MSKLVDQPSRSEGAELEAAIKQWEHDGSRLLDVIDGAKAVIADLRQAKLQAKLQAKRDELLAEEYRNAIRSLQAQVVQWQALRAEFEHINTDRDLAYSELIERGITIDTLRAELAAANEKLADQNMVAAESIEAGIAMLQEATENEERLEEQVRERDQTIADLRQESWDYEQQVSDRTMRDRLTIHDLSKEIEQLRASLEAAKANNGG